MRIKNGGAPFFEGTPPQIITYSVFKTQKFFEILIHYFHSFADRAVGFVAEPFCNFFLSNPFFRKIIYLFVGAVQRFGELITQEYIPLFFLGVIRKKYFCARLFFLLKLRGNVPTV